MGAVFTLPWTRLPVWETPCRRCRRAGFTTVALTLAPDAVDDRGRRRAASTRSRWCSAPRATACRRAGRRPPTAARSSRWRAGIDSLNVAAATAVACYVTSRR